MDHTYRPFSDAAARKRLSGALRMRVASIADFATLLGALSGRAVAVTSLRSLAADDRGFEGELVERLAPALLARALDLLESSAPELEVHRSGEAATTAIPRSRVPGWIAHMLLGTLPPVGAQHPFLDGTGLFASARPSDAAKLRCMLAYFERTATDPPPGHIEIERVVTPARSANEWLADESPLASLTVDAAGSIEDAIDARQADFANEYLGGGVLGSGCVQEEIRFAVSTELLFAMIASPRMRDDEAILVRGSERFSRTRGYARAFAWAGAFLDPSPRLEDGTPDTEVVAFDALVFRDRDPVEQYGEEALLREMNKARCAFRSDVRRRPIATGNWGCGAFRGDPALKAVLQWLAASAERRAVRYCPFGDPRVDGLDSLVDRARARFGTVGALWQRLRTLASAGRASASLFTRLLELEA